MSTESSLAPSPPLLAGPQDVTWESRLATLPLWRIVLCAGTGGVLVGFVTAAAGMSESWRRLLSMSMVYALPLACWLIVKRRRGYSSRDVIGEPLSWRIARQAVVLALATFVVHLAWIGLVTALDRVPDSWLEPIVETDGVGQEAVWALVAVVLDPPVEELAFRGVLYQRWRRRMRPAWAALGTSLFFGVLHPDPVGMTLLGLALTALMLETRSLWAPIIAHATNNAIGVALASDAVSRVFEELPLWVLGVAQLVCLPPVALLLWRNLRVP